jgi:hypothetical protein
VISELATLMDMKKAAVCETVKEHRADELSAMYNLKMDQLKQQQGKQSVLLRAQSSHYNIDA